MNVKKILVATDFSDDSATALEFATSLARDAGATLDIVHVVAPPPQSADRGPGGYAAETDDVQESERLLKQVVPSASGIAFTHALLHGTPAAKIVEFAAYNEDDLIVIGSHGRTGVLRMLTGSVAEAIVRKANCPVLTVKRPEGTSEE